MSYAKGMPAQVEKIARTDAGLPSILRISLMRLSRRLRSERDESEELTANQLAVLGTLSLCGPLTVGELAAAEKVQPPSMTRTVNSMCEKDLIRREGHPSDKRQVVVSLTERANDVLIESRRRKEAWLNQRLRELTPDERRILRDAVPVLDRLSQA